MLDLVSLFDPFGIADGINYLWYLGVGDYTNAGISAANIFVPALLGGTITAAKYVSKSVKYTKVGSKITGYASKVGKTITKNIQRRTNKIREAWANSSVRRKYANNAGTGVSGGAVENVLKFGENDLVYGPSAGRKLRELQEQSGGKLLQDIGSPYDVGLGSDWKAYSQSVMDKTLQQGNKIHFDLTYMEDVQGVLNGIVRQNATTSFELNYLKNNWYKFRNNVKFYENGMERSAPWIKY